MSETKQLGGMCSKCGWFACQCPAEPVIEVALNRCPGCDEYGASHTTPSIEHPAVPAQEAPRVNCTCEAPCHLDCTDSSCACLHHSRNKFAEPQAGAQVPSQDADKAARFERFVRTIIAEYPDDDCDSDGQMMNWLGDRLIKADAHLATIKSYATEAAKTPITREKILAAPKVEDGQLQIPKDLKPLRDALVAKSQRLGGTYLSMSEYQCIDLIGLVGRLEAQLEARKLTQEQQYDEMQGLCRLILAESGGGK